MVVARALAIADRDGLEAVTFRRLAADLRVTPMAIYGHVRDKSDLLDRMADAVLAEVVIPDQSLGWAERLHRGLVNFYETLDRHPAIAVLVARPFISPASLRLTESILAVFEDAGFESVESIRLLQVVTGMVIGPVLLSGGYGRLSGQTDQQRALESERYQLFVAGLTAGDYPRLAAVLPSLLDWSATRDPGLGLDLLLGGLDRLRRRVRKAARQPSAGRET